ncbi:MAG: molecular chaperone DnaK, partial [Propionibacteriaceae bacterium]|nr:molecular chaperone DnaK [Propionibacteriaceae bacterium]
EAADKKRREAVEMRNEADSLVFRTERLLADNAEQISDDVKAPVTEAVEKLKEALKGTDNDDEVRAAMDDLNQKASAMGQAMYQAAQAAAASAPAGDSGSSEGDGGDDGDVVDAEIVDDDK